MSLYLVEQQTSSPGVDLPTLITAIAAAITAVVAAGAVLVEGRRVRRHLGIENMWRLIDTWDSPNFRARRAEAALFLLKTFPRRPAGHAMYRIPFSIS